MSAKSKYTKSIVFTQTFKYFKCGGSIVYIFVELWSGGELHGVLFH